jgi:ribosomal protein S18 acetylase RimI-like enzyme
MRELRFMNNDQVLDLSDCNLSEFIREMTRWNPKSEIIEHDDLLFTKGADLSPATNVTIRLGPCSAAVPDEAMHHIKSFYSQYKSSYSIHIRKHADADMESICQSEKLIKLSDNPGMLINDFIPAKPLPDEVEIREAGDPITAADFASVAIESYQSLGMSAESGLKIFGAPDRLIRPYNYLVVGYLRGIPASCAMVMFSHSIAGIYWVGTVASARRLGIAEACVRDVTNKALRSGASFVVLQASNFGEPIYQRMGFKEFTQYPRYISFYRG